MIVLPDVITNGLTIVFCGSAVGTRSACVRAYYAGPGNKFWRTLYRTGLTPRQLAPSEYISLPEYGLGLTDLAKSKSGADRDIRSSDFCISSLRKKVIRFSPKVLCFNGKHAAKMYFGRTTVAYGLQQQLIGETRVFVAPSTSGAANGFWDETVWHDLADFCRPRS